MRQPVAVGFYPQESDQLRRKIKQYFSQINVLNFKARGIIVPHAGYPYSGETASYAYKAISKAEIGADENSDYKRVVLLGTNHSGLGRNISISKQSWKTPLGEVNTDQKYIEQICDQTSAVVDESAHQKEHSIEVQLPFLQHIFSENDLKIVPISIKSNITQKERRELGEFLNNPSNLLIASSDLIHYGANYRYMPADDGVEFVKKKDIEFINSVKSYNIEKVVKIGEETTICGYQPISIMLNSLKDNDLKFKLLKHTTSYEKTQDEQNIVGYCSAAFLQEK